MVRPRNPDVDENILIAARQLVRDEGWPGFTIEAVLRRSGVTRAALYRRWPTRVHLLFEVAVQGLIAAPVQDTGALRADLITSVARTVEQFEELPAGVMADLLSTMIRDTAFAAEVDNRFLQVGLGQVAARLELAHQRGEIDAAPADVIEALESMGGAIIYRVFVLHRLFDRSAVERLIDRLLGGLLGER